MTSTHTARSDQPTRQATAHPKLTSAPTNKPWIEPRAIAQPCCRRRSGKRQALKASSIGALSVTIATPQQSELLVRQSAAHFPRPEWGDACRAAALQEPRRSNFLVSPCGHRPAGRGNLPRPAGHGINRPRPAGHAVKRKDRDAEVFCESSLRIAEWSVLSSVLILGTGRRLPSTAQVDSSQGNIQQQKHQCHSKQIGP